MHHVRKVLVILGWTAQIPPVVAHALSGERRQRIKINNLPTGRKLFIERNHVFFSIADCCAEPLLVSVIKRRAEPYQSIPQKWVYALVFQIFVQR